MTADDDHGAAPDPAALELAPGEDVPVFLPSALWGLFTGDEWAGGTLSPGSRVIAGRRSYPAPLLAGLARDKLGYRVALERATVRAGTASGPGSGRRHLVPCYLVRRER